MNAAHIQSEREDRAAALLVSPVDTISQSRLKALSVGYIFSRHPPVLERFLSVSPLCFLIFSPLLFSPSHPRASFTQVLLFACQLFPSTPSHTISSIAHYQFPTPSSHHPFTDCSNLPRIGRNSLGIASWGARCRTENGTLVVSCKRPAQPAGIGAVLARLFPASPVPSGPVRYGSVRGDAGADPGAPAVAPVVRGSRRLVPYHPRLVSRHFTCGATARLPILPQRLPNADRLELLR